MRMLNWMFVDWVKVGRNVLWQLPLSEHKPFIKWLEDNPNMLDLYESSPGRAVRFWRDSIERYQICS